MASSLVLDARIGDRALSFPGTFMLNPLLQLPLYAGFWGDDPAWVGPGVGQAVSSWRNGGTLAASGAYLDPTLGLVLPGVAGNYAYVPDEAALDITGDITLVARLTPNDWSPSGSTQLVIAKYIGSGNQRSYRMDITTTGLVSITTTSDGSTGTIVTGASTTAVPFADGSGGWIAAALDVDDGAGNRVYTFWTSTDGVTWAQLGTTVTAVGTTSIHAGTALCEFGSLTNGTAQLLTGSLQVARVYSGSGFTTAGPSGTLVLDVDFRRTSVGAFTCSTGQTVTVSSTFNALQGTAGSRPTLTTSALLGGRRVVDFDGLDDRLVITSGVSLAQPFEVWWIGHYDSLVAAGTQVGLNSTSNLYMTGANTTPSHRLSMGTTYTTGTPVADTAYLVRSVANGASSLMYVNGAAGGVANAGALAVDQIVLGAGRTAPSTYAYFLNGKTAFLGILPAASITAAHRRAFALWAASFYSVPGFAAAA